MQTTRRIFFWSLAPAILIAVMAYVIWSMQQQKSLHTLHFQEEIPGLGRTIEIELIELDPPVDSWRDEFLAPSSKQNLPWWVESRFWPLRLKEKDLPRLFTKKYLEQSRELGGVALHREPPSIFSRTTHAIRVKAGKYEYYFVASAFADKREDLDEWGPLTGTRSNEEGEWKIDAPPDWARFFRFSDKERMIALLKSRTARLDELNTLVPVDRK